MHQFICIIVKADTSDYMRKKKHNDITSGYSNFLRIDRHIWVVKQAIFWCMVCNLPNLDTADIHEYMLSIYMLQE